MTIAGRHSDFTQLEINYIIIIYSKYSNIFKPKEKLLQKKQIKWGRYLGELNLVMCDLIQHYNIVHAMSGKKLVKWVNFISI